MRSSGEIERFIRGGSAGQAQALVMGAGRTFGNYVKAVREIKENQPEIPSEYWAEPIRALNPIKVYLDRGNVVVVERIENGTEQGKYLVPLTSSYLPRSGRDGFVFMPDPANSDRRDYGHGVLDFRRKRGK